MQLNSRIQHNSVGSDSGFLKQRPPLLQKVPQASKTRNLGAGGRGSSTAPPAASARAEPGPCAPRPGWAQPGREERQRQPEPRGREGSAEGLRGGEGRAGPGRAVWRRVATLGLRGARPRLRGLLRRDSARPPQRQAPSLCFPSPSLPRPAAGSPRGLPALCRPPPPRPARHRRPLSEGPARALLLAAFVLVWLCFNEVFPC